jgi:Flp pilus assembly pilin Flp
VKRGETGASAVEYGLMVAACAAILVAVLFSLNKFGVAIFETSACDSAAGYHCNN